MAERRGSVVEKERQHRLVDPFQIERDELTHLKPSFISNAVRTSKYTYLNFLPLCLLQEFRRKKRSSDRFINSRPVAVVRNFQELQVVREAIRVGDILRICERESIPADGIILSSSEDNGEFISHNLDGEANLKSREALRATLGFAFDQNAREKTKYFIKCEQPNQDLYRFAGNLSVDSKLYSLSEKQFLMRGSTLMNTKWVWIVVVYTGHDTKIMKNARAAHHKLSHLEILTNRTVIVVFIVQVLLCAVAAGLHHFQFSEARMGHIGETKHTSEVELVLTFLSFVVLMNTLIPISLVVTVEIIKTIHAKFITWDDQMRSSNGAGALANTTSLTDELGQVRYIFTDKTGTLTQNQMAFRKCSVGGSVYSVYTAPQKRSSLALAGVSISSLDTFASHPPTTFHSEKPEVTERRDVACFRRSLSKPEAVERRLAVAMALCHTVICEHDLVTGAVAYNSDSPDECALVRGADLMGVKLLERRGQRVYLSLTEEDREGSHLKTVTYTLAFEILRVLHFSSDRKRMSVIVRDEDGRLKVLCKGADSVILDRCDRFLSDQSETMNHVTQFAEEGFRILLLAERPLLSYFEEWEARYDKAELDMHAKDAKTEELVDELERNLTLIGASAVEDKLQVGVPETISLFQKAGIKVAARNQIWVLTGDKLETSLQMGKLCRVVTPSMREVVISGSNRDEMTEQLEKAFEDANENQALVIDGDALTLALRPCNRDKFLQLALRSATVLVCRTSPIQKALVVELVKSGVPYVTLAVYTVFCDLYITAYNVLFTALPVIVRAVMETDLLEAFAVQFPELYRLGPADACLSCRTMAASALLATFHAVVATVVPLEMMHRGGLGGGSDFWSGSVASFCYIVLIVHLHIFYETWNWTAAVGITYAASLVVFVLAIAAYDRVAGDVEGVWSSVVGTSGFWLGFFLASVACMLPGVAYKWYVTFGCCVFALQREGG
ncbi:hypothetical protein BBJ28_00019083 [Nothophytophthora sp. Chile5]|nr:hypothetical protein BBJ28_00019083 [Nothophytophthora sp. Chile5]